MSTATVRLLPCFLSATHRTFAMIQGVGRFLARRPDWEPIREPWRPRAQQAQLDLEGVDAILFDHLPQQEQERLAARGIATVSVSQAMPRDQALFTRVVPDSHAVGRVAAEALLDLGLRRLAFVGQPAAFSADRQAGFCQAADEAGVVPHVFPLKADDGWQRFRSRLADWLAQLPSPAGLLASNDNRARLIVQLAGKLGIDVPQDLAVIGVDNDPLTCQFERPSISSVSMNFEQLGFRAAEVLERCLVNPGQPRVDVLCPPGPVVHRQSTAMIAAEDPVIADAIAYVRTHASRGISVEDVLARTPISRSKLERGFRVSIGRPPGQEIRRIQLRVARQLLEQTDLPIKRVAQRCGFRDGRHLTQAFTHAVGQSPTRYRETHRDGQV